MTHHLVRVELHDAKGYDYTKLHAEMKIIGLLPTYETPSAVYQLPTAEYYKKSIQTAEELHDAVVAAVKKALVKETEAVKKANNSPMIVVSTFTFYGGLKVIKKKAA